MSPVSWPTAVSIETRRTRLEPLRPEHAEEMSLVLADPRLHEYTGGHPETLDQLRARYARQSADRPGWLNWIIRVRESYAAIGTVQATLERRGEGTAAQIAWVIAPTHQRRGYAKEAAGGMLDWLRQDGTDVFVAHIHPGHRASIAVARHLGLTPTEVIVDGEVRWEMSPVQRR